MSGGSIDQEGTKVTRQVDREVQSIWVFHHQSKVSCYPISEYIVGQFNISCQRFSHFSWATGVALEHRDYELIDQTKTRDQATKFRPVLVTTALQVLSMIGPVSPHRLKWLVALVSGRGNPLTESQTSIG